MRRVRRKAKRSNGERTASSSSVGTRSVEGAEVGVSSGERSKLDSTVLTFVSVGPAGLRLLSVDPGAARFAFAPGYLLAAPPALTCQRVVVTAEVRRSLIESLLPSRRAFGAHVSMCRCHS